MRLKVKGKAQAARKLHSLLHSAWFVATRLGSARLGSVWTRARVVVCQLVCVRALLCFRSFVRLADYRYIVNYCKTVVTVAWSVIVAAAAAVAAVIASAAAA